VTALEMFEMTSSCVFGLGVVRVWRSTAYMVREYRQAGLFRILFRLEVHSLDSL